MSLTIYYDGDCPMCTRFVTMLRLSEQQQVALADLRGLPDKRAEFEGLGYKVDDGMVVDQSGQLYSGADAVNVLALLSTPSGLFDPTS